MSHTSATHMHLVGQKNLNVFERKKMALRNNMTNFIDANTRSFEKQIYSTRFGALPGKESNNEN
jgi:hypothetical protein